MILDEIIAYKKAYLEEIKKNLPESKFLRRLNTLIPTKKRNFKEALKKDKGVSLIAELKKASPSGGIIVRDYYPEKIAGIYEKAGASCISVLTDERFFKGNLSHLQLVKVGTNLPVLRKDFIIDKCQIFESAFYGADALLLIARILNKKTLKEFIGICRDYNITPLVEVHSKEDLDKTLGLKPDVIGINNRDLDTLKVDLETTKRLVKYIPKGILKISESGISARKDIEYLKSLGVDAVLIGEALLKSIDIKKKIKELFKFSNS